MFDQYIFKTTQPIRNIEHYAHLWVNYLNRSETPLVQK